MPSGSAESFQCPVAPMKPYKTTHAIAMVLLSRSDCHAVLPGLKLGNFWRTGPAEATGMPESSSIPPAPDPGEPHSVPGIATPHMAMLMTLALALGGCTERGRPGGCDAPGSRRCCLAQSSVTPRAPTDAGAALSGFAADMTSVDIRDLCRAINSRWQCAVPQRHVHHLHGHWLHSHAGVHHDPDAPVLPDPASPPSTNCVQT